jgi:hypothetical protein
MTVQSAYTVTANQLRQTVAKKTGEAAGKLNGKGIQDLTAGEAARVTVAQSKVAQANGFLTNARVTGTTLSGIETQMNTIRDIYSQCLDIATAATNPQLKQSDRASMNSTIQGLLAQAQNVVNTYSDPIGNKPLTGNVMGVANTGAAAAAVNAIVGDATATDITAANAYTNLSAIGALNLTTSQKAQLYNLSLTPGMTATEFVAGSLGVIGATQGLDASALQPNLAIATKVAKICALLPAAVAVANGAAATARNNLIALLTNQASVNTADNARNSGVDLAANAGTAQALAALLSPSDITALQNYGKTAAAAAGNNMTAPEIFPILQQISGLTQITKIDGTPLANTMIDGAGALQGANGAQIINEYVLKAATGALATATQETVQVGFAATDTVTLNIPNCSNWNNGVGNVTITGTTDTDISGAQTAITQFQKAMSFMDKNIALVKTQDDILSGRIDGLNTNIQDYSNDISQALDADPVEAFSDIKLLQAQSDAANLLDYVGTSSKLEDARTAKVIAQS